MYNKTLIILLSGKAGVGKSYFAKKLAEQFTLKKLTVATSYFALGIKEVASKYIGWDGKKDERGRKLLQELGTEVGRAYNPDCWIEYLLGTLENNANYPFDVIIIDDWRFPNEYEYLLGDPIYTPVKVRIISDKVKVTITEKSKQHESEMALPENESYYNYVIFNDFTDSNSLSKAIDLCNELDDLQSKL